MRRRRSREAEEARVAAFNAKYPIGTPVRCWHDTRRTTATDTVVREPGAFVAGSGHASVKVAKGSFNMDFVEVLG